MKGEEAKVERRSDDDGERRVLTASIAGRRLALITYGQGWDKVDSLVHSGRNAEAEESTVLFAYRKRTRPNPAMELMISVLLHRTDDGPWSEEELHPIREYKTMDITPSLSALGVELKLQDGRTLSVDFVDVDGRRRC